MIIAPTTSNIAAMIALRIGDSLIPNAAIMGQKYVYQSIDTP